MSLGQALNDLGNVRLSAGDAAAAEPLFARALGLFDKALGADDDLTIAVQGNLASAYRALGRSAEADAAQARAKRDAGRAILRRLERWPGHEERPT